MKRYEKVGGGGNSLAISRVFNSCQNNKCCYCGDVVNYYNFQKGFTLAEVLITLGIIGVVAALTLPSLVANYRKQILHSQFKKMYSDLNNASRQFMFDNDMSVYDYSVANDQGRSNNSLRKFVTYLKGTDNIIGVSSGTGNLGDLEPRHLNGNTTGRPCDESGVAKDVNGRFITFDNAATTAVQMGPKLCVDINGAARPNKWGYDWFVFVFTNDGYVKPYIGNNVWGITDENIPDDELKNYCSYTGSIYVCAYFALSDKHPQDSSKSYWKDFLK